MQAICFQCKFVGIGLQGGRCPSCGYTLIVNSEALAASEIEGLLRRSRPMAVAAPPLPGVNPEPRKAALLAARRRERAATALEARKAAARRARRRKIVMTELAAASALLAGVFIALNVFGAL